MNRLILFSLIGIVLASTSTAVAHNTPWAWSPPRAAQMVIADAIVQFPSAERTSLEAEIRSARSAYMLAELIASDEADWFAGMYHNLVLRLTKALDRVQKGLSVDKARCKGVGRASKGRFKHFRCAVNSQSEIPTVARIDREADRQIVVEGPPRIIGPLEATLDVHSRGRFRSHTDRSSRCLALHLLSCPRRSSQRSRSRRAPPRRPSRPTSSSWPALEQAWTAARATLNGKAELREVIEAMRRARRAAPHAVGALESPTSRRHSAQDGPCRAGSAGDPAPIATLRPETSSGD